MPAPFLDRLDHVLCETNSLVSVGLDPDPARTPSPLRGQSRTRQLDAFLGGIVGATRPYVSAYKMQLAAYWSYGAAGFAALERVVRKIGPRRIKILDLKANDIPNTMRLLADGAFDVFGFDAITVTPWVGWESLVPVAARPDRGYFVVAHTSNPGSRDFQEIRHGSSPLWIEIVRTVGRLSRKNGNAGVVIGATDPRAVAQARAALGERGAILLPGIGAQRGDLAASISGGVDRHGRGLLAAASRSIVYASSKSDWRAAAGLEARRLRDDINDLRAPRRRA
ncbi:orotidine 5'-phosphate decarboxylase [mine drainage metagenome]|uniref:Orotidine 5'-phosphate decarboxylase n=1 Tax=mine drainage metagenome TaxID=410659 RepID=T1A2P4_9ZZZZ